MFFSTSARPDEDSDRLLGMNMTPLIGVILVLIMVMLIGVPRQRDMLLWKLSSLANVSCDGMMEISVTQIAIDFDDSILWDGHVISLEEMQTRLSQINKTEALPPAVYLKPSFMTSHASLVSVTNGIRRSGIDKIRLEISEFRTVS
ncbi:ExbD/TolR family protein [Undibacterium sp. Tian12W]|uniref:ExbD/TolR family protein n=1 Tax=Undibacterium sp. Tian12W TaxID=3413054 RepID=UPI003BF019EF